MNQKRLKKQERQQILLDAGLDYASRCGYLTLTQQALANETGISRTLVYHHFQNTQALRDAIMEHAVTKGRAVVVAQGLLVGHPASRKAPTELRRKAANLITA